MTFDPHRRRVRDEMSTDVVSIASNASLLTALNMMEASSVTALPVLDEDSRCIGMISTTDIACAARATAVDLQKLDEAGDDDRAGLVKKLVQEGMIHKSVHQAMRFKLKCVHEDTSLAKAGSKMLWTRFHHLPVVDKERQLVGIISTLDLLAAFVKSAPSKSDAVPVDETMCETIDAEDTVGG